MKLKNRIRRILARSTNKSGLSSVEGGSPNFPMIKWTSSRSIKFSVAGSVQGKE